VEKARFDVFLSHATPDKPAVEELARLLKKRGFAPWLDKWNLIPGEPWQEAIEKALEDCTACAVCLGPSGTGPWQNEEMRAAIDRRVSGERAQFRVIPVLLPGAERGEPSRLPAFLRATTWVEFRETLDDEMALHRLDCGIRGIPPGSDPGEAVAEGACPYRGLQVFDVGDALFFFGREALTGWLLDKLRTDRTGNRFLAVVGPSGSGKSSLARAGLIANLKRGEIPGSDTWPVAICKPGAQPLESLAVALAGAARLGDSPSAVRELIRDLGSDPRMLHLTTRLSLRDAPADRRLVVLVDQFEEVFTLCPDEAQRQAILANLLHAATAADGQTVVVVTLRADFYGRCAVYPDLAAAISDRQSLVGPMTRDELRSAVERPAYLTGCELEGGLADLLLNEVAAQPGSLPLLEHALLQIWQRREGGRRLTVAAYQEIGGVAGALEKHAEEVYSGFSEDEKETCRRVFLRLVQVDEQGRATKRRLSLDDLPPETAEDSKPVGTVVGRLIDARLLTSDQEKHPTVELAHEALLAHWERLKTWIEQDHEALRTRRRLDEAVAEWLGRNRDPSFLLEGGRLAQAEEWAERHPREIGPEVRDFLTASVAERDRERQRELDQAKALEEEQRRRADSEHQRAEEQGLARRRLKVWTIASIVTAAVAIAAAGTALYLKHLADQQQSVAVASDLAANSTLIAQRDSALGLLLSVKAVQLAALGGQPHLSLAEEALRENLSVFRGSPLSTGRVRAASVSPDRSWLAVSGTDGATSLWSLGDKGPVIRLKIEGKSAGSSVGQVAVSAGGKWLLASYEEGAYLHQLDADHHQHATLFLKGEDWLLGSDPFSLDGGKLLTRRESDTWALRDLADPSRTIIALKIRPSSLAFSPNGQWLAALELGSLAVWDLVVPSANLRFRIPVNEKLHALVFSSDSQWVVAAEPGKDGAVQAWKLSQPSKMGPAVSFSLQTCKWSEPEAPSAEDPPFFPKIPSFASCFVFISLAGDVKVRLGVEPFTTAAADLQSNIFAAGSEAGIIRIGHLDMKSVSPWAGRFQAGPIWLLALQGRWLVSQGGGDPPRKLEVLPGLNIEGPEPLGLTHIPGTVAISTQGWRLSVEAATHKATFWGPQGPQPVGAAEQAVAPWTFSPDGQWFAAAGLDGRPRVWQINMDGTASEPKLFSTQFHHGFPVTALSFSPNQLWLASGDQNGNSRLWSLKSMQAEPRPLTNSEGGAAAFAFSPDGRHIATAARNGPAVRLRDLNDDGPAAADRPEFPANRLGPSGIGLGGPASAIAFLPDGRLALGSVGNQIELWQAKRPGKYLDSKTPDTSFLAASANAKHLASVSSNGTVQVWSIEGRDPYSEPVRLRGVFKSLAFTPDGNGLWTVDNAGLLQHWTLETEELLETACKAVGRNLTEREWKQYIPSERYQERKPCLEFPKAYD
jgi:WD40 repeat protein/energy-coupling factor transporter ATP-binding protein EcfA2